VEVGRSIKNAAESKIFTMNDFTGKTIWITGASSGIGAITPRSVENTIRLFRQGLH